MKSSFRIAAPIICGVTALGTCASTANAAPVTYSGVDAGAVPGNPHPNSDAALAAFLAVAPNTTLETFETINPPFRVGFGAILADTPNGGNPVNLYGFNTTAGGRWYISLSGGSFTLTFNQAIDSFGAYLTGVQLPTNVLITAAGAFQPPSPSNGGVQFFGFTTFDQPITTISFSSGSDIIGIDDVRFHYAASATAVPEPASWAMFIGGFGLIGGMVRRPNRGSKKIVVA